MLPVRKVLLGDDAPAWLPWALRFLEQMKRVVGPMQFFERAAQPADGVFVQVRQSPAGDVVCVKTEDRDGFYLCFYDPDTAPNGWNADRNATLLGVASGTPLPVVIDPDSGTVDKSFTRIKNTANGLVITHGQEPVPPLAWKGGRGGKKMRCYGGYFKEFVRGSYDARSEANKSLLRVDKSGVPYVERDKPTTEKILAGKKAAVLSAAPGPAVAAVRLKDTDDLASTYLLPSDMLQDANWPCRCTHYATPMYDVSPFTASLDGLNMAAAYGGGAYTSVAVIRCGSNGTFVQSAQSVGVPPPKNSIYSPVYTHHSVRSVGNSDACYVVLWGSVYEDGEHGVVPTTDSLDKHYEGTDWNDYTYGDAEFLYAHVSAVSSWVDAGEAVPFIGLPTGYGVSEVVYPGQPLFESLADGTHLTGWFGRMCVLATEPDTFSNGYSTVYAGTTVLHESVRTLTTKRIRGRSISWRPVTVGVAYIYNHDENTNKDVHIETVLHVYYGRDAGLPYPDYQAVEAGTYTVSTGSRVYLTLVVGECYGVTEVTYTGANVVAGVDLGESVFTLYAPDSSVLLTRSVEPGLGEPSTAIITSPARHGVWDHEEKVGYFEVRTSETVRECFILYFDAVSQKHKVEPCLRATNFHMS